MKLEIIHRFPIHELALLHVATAVVGYYDKPPPSISPVDSPVHLNLDALDDDSITDVHISPIVDGNELGRYLTYLTCSTYDTTSHIAVPVQPQKNPLNLAPLSTRPHPA